MINSVLRPIRLGVMFAGGGVGTADLSAGCHVAWGVEYDPKIAAIHSLNHPDSLTIAQDVSAVDYGSLPPVDILQASPVCKVFSKASGAATETDTEIDQAQAICRALRALRPQGFILENVRGYAGSDSIRLIGATLTDMDYCMDLQVINAADYGVPQSRERLIMRAKAGGLFGSLPPIPGKVSQHTGWYAAIEDLIPYLPIATLAPWQVKRIQAAIAKGMVLHTSFFIGGANKSESFLQFAIDNRPSIPGIRNGHDPVMTVPADVITNMAGRAVLIDGKLSSTGPDKQTSLLQVTGPDAPSMAVISSYNTMKDTRAVLVDIPHSSRPPTVLEDEQPAMTVQSWHGRRVSHAPTAWYESGVVVRMTPRALARFQSIPNRYLLPDSPRLAITIIGNGVPARLGRLIVDSML